MNAIFFYQNGRNDLEQSVLFFRKQIKSYVGVNKISSFFPMGIHSMSIFKNKGKKGIIVSPFSGSEVRRSNNLTVIGQIKKNFRRLRWAKIRNGNNRIIQYLLFSGLS